MVPAESSMDFSQELPPFLFEDAPLEHSGRAFLIEFPFMDFVSFRTPDDPWAGCRTLIFRSCFSSRQITQELPPKRKPSWIN